MLLKDRCRAPVHHALLARQVRPPSLSVASRTISDRLSDLAEASGFLIVERIGDQNKVVSVRLKRTIDLTGRKSDLVFRGEDEAEPTVLLMGWPALPRTSSMVSLH